MTFAVRVTVRGHEGIADPEGRTIERALGALGFSGASRVHCGKIISFDLEAPDAATARAVAREMCERLLANPVIERYDIDLEAIG